MHVWLSRQADTYASIKLPVRFDTSPILQDLRACLSIVLNSFSLLQGFLNPLQSFWYYQIFKNYGGACCYVESPLSYQGDDETTHLLSLRRNKGLLLWSVITSLGEDWKKAFGGGGKYADILQTLHLPNKTFSLLFFFSRKDPIVLDFVCGTSKLMSFTYAVCSVFFVYGFWPRFLHCVELFGFFVFETFSLVLYQINGNVVSVI